MPPTINAALAIIEAIPILDKWFRELTKAYVEKRRAKNDVEFEKALGLAKTESNVEELAASIGKHLDD